MPMRSNIAATQLANSNDNQSEFIVCPTLSSPQVFRANVTVAWLLELQIRAFPQSCGPPGCSQIPGTREPHFCFSRFSGQRLPVQSSATFLTEFPKPSLPSSREKLPKRAQ